ncbi:MAG: hypothetical protein V2B13_08435 [Pseudomonadota bacterium]
MEHQKILSDYRSKSKARNNLILQFNYLLDKKSHFYSFNERDLEDLIKQLDNLVLFQDGSYRLTLARINELALLCTENYANNGELTLAGDLLFNPRLSLVHVSGYYKPIAKKRHTPLSEQFRGVAESYQDVVQWLQTETFLETRTEALLPHLHQRLEKSGYFCPEYLESLNKRKTKINALTEFLSGRGLTDSLDLFHWIKNASPSDRDELESKRCSCNLDLFFELGRQVNELAGGPLVYVREKSFSGLVVPQGT